MLNTINYRLQFKLQDYEKDKQMIRKIVQNEDLNKKLENQFFNGEVRLDRHSVRRLIQHTVCPRR